jgi:hypothetical protein
MVAGRNSCGPLGYLLLEGSENFGGRFGRLRNEASGF